MVETISEANFQQSFKHLTFKPTVTFPRVNSNNTSDNDGIASNGKLIAMSWASTSTVAVFSADKPRTFDASIPLIKGHNGAIQDVAWSPFEDRLLATCADDGKAKFWVFDDYEGLTKPNEHLMECDLELDAHPRKCLSVQWHEACENLLATHSVDKTIKVWDIHEDRADEAAITFTDMPDFTTSIRWSPDGKMIAGMCKNKSMVLFDPRLEASAVKTASHQGPR